MKLSMQTVIPHFSTDRMVKEYTERCYIEAARQGKNYTKENYEKSKSTTAWKNKIISQWNQIHIDADSITKSDAFQEVSLKEGFPVSVAISLGPVKTQDVLVEIYYRKVDDKGNITEENLINGMKLSEELGNGKFRYNGILNPLNGGHYEYTIRVIPFLEGMAHKFEMGLIKWLD
jgi:starch phosphorylase